MSFLDKLFGKLGKLAREFFVGEEPSPVSPLPKEEIKLAEMESKFASERPEEKKLKDMISTRLFQLSIEEERKGNNFNSRVFRLLSNTIDRSPTLKLNETPYGRYLKTELKLNLIPLVSKQTEEVIKDPFQKTLLQQRLSQKQFELFEEYTKLRGDKRLFPEEEGKDILDIGATFTGRLVRSLGRGYFEGLLGLPYYTINFIGNVGTALLISPFGLAYSRITGRDFVLDDKVRELFGGIARYSGAEFLARKGEEMGRLFGEDTFGAVEEIGKFLGSDIGARALTVGKASLFLWRHIDDLAEVANAIRKGERVGEAAKIFERFGALGSIAKNTSPYLLRGLGFAAWQLYYPEGGVKDVERGGEEVFVKNLKALPRRTVELAIGDIVLSKVGGLLAEKVGRPIAERFLGKKIDRMVDKISEPIEKEVLEKTSGSLAAVKQDFIETVKKELRAEISGNKKPTGTLLFSLLDNSAYRKEIKEKVVYLNVNEKNLDNPVYLIATTLHQKLRYGDGLTLDDAIRAVEDFNRFWQQKTGERIVNTREVAEKIYKYVLNSDKLALQILLQEKSLKTAKESFKRVSVIGRKLQRLSEIFRRDIEKLLSYDEARLRARLKRTSAAMGVDLLETYEKLSSKDPAYTLKDFVFDIANSGVGREEKLLDKYFKQLQKIEVPKVKTTLKPVSLEEVLGDLEIDEEAKKKLAKKMGLPSLDELSNSDYKDFAKFREKATLVFNRARNENVQILTDIDMDEKSLVDNVEGKFVVDKIFENLSKQAELLNVLYPTHYKPIIKDVDNELYRLARDTDSLNEFLRKLGDSDIDVVEVLKNEEIPDVVSYFNSVKLYEALKSEKLPSLKKLASKFLPRQTFELLLGEQVGIRTTQKIKFIVETLPDALDTVAKKYYKEMDKLGGNFFRSGEFYQKLEKVAKEIGAENNFELLQAILASDKYDDTFKELAKRHIAFFDGMRKFINSIRNTTGKEKIPEIVGYVPHKLREGIAKMIESAEVSKVMTKDEVKAYKERMFRELVVGNFFSNDPKEILDAYMRGTKYFIGGDMLRSFFTMTTSDTLAGSFEFARQKVLQMMGVYKVGKPKLNFLGELENLLKGIQILRKKIDLSPDLRRELETIRDGSDDPLIKRAIDKILTEGAYDLNFLGKALFNGTKVALQAVSLPFQPAFVMMKVLGTNPNFILLSVGDKFVTAPTFGARVDELIKATAKTLWYFGLKTLGDKDAKKLITELKHLGMISSNVDDPFILKVFNVMLNKMEEFMGLQSYFASDYFWNRIEKAAIKGGRKEVAELISQHKQALINYMGEILSIPVGRTETAPSKVGNTFVQMLFLFKNYLLNLSSMQYNYIRSAFFRDKKATRRIVELITSRAGVDNPQVFEVIMKEIDGDVKRNVANWFASILAGVGFVYATGLAMKETMDLAYYLATGENPRKQDVPRTIEEKAKQAAPLFWFKGMLQPSQFFGYKYISEQVVPLMEASFKLFTSYVESVKAGTFEPTKLALADFVDKVDKLITPEGLKRLDDVLFLVDSGKLPSRKDQPTISNLVERVLGGKPDIIREQYEYEGNPLYALFGRSALPEYSRLEKVIETQQKIRDAREYVRNKFLNYYYNQDNDRLRQEWLKAKDWYEKQFGTRITQTTLKRWISDSQKPVVERSAQTLPKDTREMILQEEEETDFFKSLLK